VAKANKITAKPAITSTSMDCMRNSKKVFVWYIGFGLGLYRRTWQDGGKMLHHALFGFLRVSLICRCDKVVPEKLFRRRILCDTPAISTISGSAR
jgi:hypothetical protein